RPRRGPVPGPQLLPVGGAQSPLDLPHCRDLVDLAGDFRFFLSYPWNVHRAVEAVSTHKGGSIMAQKAIVKLCMCLVLVLLVGVATSAWSQSASGDNKGKGYSDSKKAAMCGGIAGTKCPEGQACKYPIGKCKVSDLAGTCTKVPKDCPKTK